MIKLPLFEAFLFILGVASVPTVIWMTFIVLDLIEKLERTYNTPF